jgi:hypothetical protein
MLGRLDGEIGFTVTGGLFAFEGLFVYADSNDPTITLSCAGPPAP